MIALAILASSPAALQFGEQVGNASEWIRDSDNDQVLAVGTVVFKVIINPEGKPDRCVILQRKGDPAVERLACAAVFKRFRYRPALGVDGQPTYAVFPQRASYRVTGAAQPPPKAEPLVVTDTTGSLSAEDNGKRLSLVVAVNRDGMIIKCAPFQWAKKKDVQTSVAACNSLAASWKQAPELNAEGVAIEYLGSFDIELRHPASAMTHEP